MIDWHSFVAPAAGAAKVQAPQEAIRTEDIHRQLERICTSKTFRGSLRLTRFLRFVVETTLAGKSDTVKAYTIAVEALDRGCDFNPESDPIVRVEAGRLRHALARYYAEAGRDDAVAIDLPRGTYVPVFHRPGTENDNASAPAPYVFEGASEDLDCAPPSGAQRAVASANLWTRATRTARIALYAVSVLAILQVLFDIDQQLTGGGNRGLLFKLWPTRNAVAVQSPAIAGEPVIYVEPVTAVGDPTPDVPRASMIRERMFNALARFDDVTVVSDPPRDGPAASPSASKFAGKLAPNYRLSTAVNYFPDGAVMEAVRLIDAADGTIVWAKSYDHKGDPNPNRPRGHISSDVAQTLLQQFGVIQAREASKRTNADPMQDSYRCILDTNAYQRGFNPSLYGPARDCLEHATAESHPLDGVFVKLARLYVSDYQFGGAGGPAGNRAALDRAYQMAVRAVDIKPTSAVAQFAMEQVLLARRDFEQAKVAGENALSLNPYDNAVIFGRAARLILTGQIDEGMAALRQNTNKKSAVWTGHHFLLALGSYLKDDLATAEMEISQISNENFPPGLMLDALVAAHNKNRLRARHDIEVLYAKYPSWRDDAHANIGYFLPDHDMADSIGNEFEAVALDLKKHPDVVGSVKPAEHP
jgi:adenylate cyclase